MKLKSLYMVLTLLPFFVSAQEIDNTLSYKNINCDRYFRLNYENDFFSATDIYYTQGVAIELVSPSLSAFPLSKLLLQPHYGGTRYGIALEHDGYTPTSIGHDEILYGDRPFAATLTFKSFQISIDTIKKQRFSTTLTVGIIGPAAGGAEMQTGIHSALNNVIPHGWPNQIHNDAVLNYQVDYEKQLVSLGKIFSIDGDAIARVGTLSDKAGLGFTLMMGYFDSPFQTNIAKGKNFRLYAYDHPQVNVIGYDATLEGGLFNHSSPYTIASSQLNRITFQNRFGFVLEYRRIYLEYFQSYLSREFETGTYHVWGGIQLAFGL
ncbi:MAG: lipid A deacylase LpxR family protein [Bacteroidetes bacterium]|nr:lipid A deacylase LpxR family protein [Bacteroidota bacterium]